MSSGRWTSVARTILNGDPGSDCFVPIELPDNAAYPGALDDILAFRIRCDEAAH